MKLAKVLLLVPLVVPAPWANNVPQCNLLGQFAYYIAQKRDEGVPARVLKLEIEADTSAGQMNKLVAYNAVDNIFASPLSADYVRVTTLQECYDRIDNRNAPR